MSRPVVFVTRRIPDVGLDLLASACEIRINPNDKPIVITSYSIHYTKLYDESRRRRQEDRALHRECGGLRRRRVWT